MNKIILLFLSVFGVIGLFFIWFLLTGWVMDSFKEAKEKNKRIEFSSLILSILATILSIISLYFSLR